MAHKVEVIEDVDVRVGRGIVAYKAGYKGSVKEEAYAQLIASGKALDATPARKSKAKDKDEDASGPTA